MSAFDKHIGHRRHFTPERLRQLLLDAGLQVESLNGAGFSPFFNLYRLTVVARGKKLIDDARRVTLPGRSADARRDLGVRPSYFAVNRNRDAGAVGSWSPHSGGSETAR